MVPLHSSFEIPMSVKTLTDGTDGGIHRAISSITGLDDFVTDVQVET